jgi:hypothetical protein
VTQVHEPGVIESIGTQQAKVASAHEERARGLGLVVHTTADPEAEVFHVPGSEEKVRRKRT